MPTFQRLPRVLLRTLVCFDLLAQDLAIAGAHDLVDDEDTLVLRLLPLRGNLHLCRFVKRIIPPKPKRAMRAR